LVAAIVAFAYRIIAAHSVHHVRGTSSPLTPAQSSAQRRSDIFRLSRVQAVGSFFRTSQHEEANAATAVILKLQWELDRIPRELVNCGITCLTLFAEGDAKDPSSIVGRQRSPVAAYHARELEICATLVAARS
jgi:hypothetical protein